MASELPKPEFRQRVRELAESQWHESASVVYLSKVKPEFHVPGRRKDGTIKGKRLIRRFFWNLLRGTFAVLVNIVVFFVLGERPGFSFDSSLSSVTGPKNAQALGLVDAARSARGRWLVHSSSHVAVFDAGDTSVDPTDGPSPKILWHAAKPHAPLVRQLGRRLIWPDGSVFKYHVSSEELKLLKETLRS